jgi:hypothetical protein
MGESYSRQHQGVNMKTFRLISFYLILVIAFSAWTPSPVLAKQTETGTSQQFSAKAKAKTDKPTGKTRLVYINKTGGVLAITLTGKNGNYFFTVANNSRGTFFIKSGKYQVQLISSGPGCPVKPRTWNANYTNTKESQSGPWVCARRR